MEFRTIEEVLERLEKGNCKADTFKEMEKTLCFGVKGKVTKKKTFEHESECPVYVTAEIFNPKRVELVEHKKGCNVSLKCEIEKKFGLVDYKTHRLCRKNADGEIVISKTWDEGAYLYTTIEKRYVSDPDFTDDQLIEEFKNRTNGIKQICKKFDIDASACAYNSAIVTRNIAYEKVKYFDGMEDIDDEEAEVLHGANRGAIHFASRDEVIEDCYDYDMNSMYGYLLTVPEFRFPVQKYKKVPINEPDDAKCLYIYKLKLLSGHHYFNKTPDDNYTNYHLELINALNIKYEFVGEYKYKYEWPMNAFSLFGDTMKSLFDLKRNGNKYAKEVMNNFYSSLSQLKELSIPIEDYNQNGKIHKAEKVRSVDIKTGRITLESGNKPYKHKLGRLQVFTLSYARLYMVTKLLLPTEALGYEVYQCNTDGFVTDCPPKEMKGIRQIDSDMGNLKLEKEFLGRWKIENVHNIVRL